MNFSNALPDASHDESQSSQILDFVLGGHTAPPDGTKPVPLTSAGRENASVDNIRQAGGASGGGDASSCPSGSSSGSSFSRYHFHGLANTQQTQTQQSQFQSDDSYLVVEDESSQKENTPTVAPPNKSLTAITTAAEAYNRHEAPLTLPPPLKSSNIGPAAPQQPLPLTERAPPTKTKVKFLSPQVPGSPSIKTPKEMPFSFKRKRSPSPSSQDSFAAAPAFENPDVYLANAKQFDRPLDQLGLDSQEDNSQSSVTNQSRPHEQVPVPNESHNNTRGAMRSPSEITPYSLSSASIGGTGRILVANSDESRSNTQDSNNSAANRSGSSDGPGDLGVGNFSQEPTQVVGPSTISRESLTSSLFVEQELEGPPSRVIEESPQPAREQQQQQQQQSDSQQATQEDDPNEASGSLAASSVVSDKRHILNLVPPEKRHRYMRPGADFTPRVDQERVANTPAAVASGSRFRFPNPVRETDDIDVVPDSEPQINVNDSSVKSMVPASSRTESSREEVIPPTPSEPTASVLEERNRNAHTQPPRYEEEEEEEEKTEAPKQEVKAAEEVEKEDVVEEVVEEVQEEGNEEVVAPKATKGRKPALGMKGKPRKAAAAPRSRNAQKKSDDAYKPGSVGKRGQGKKASSSKPAPEDDAQETPPRVIRKQPARTKAANSKGKGKAVARETPATSGRGTPVTTNAHFTPVPGPSGAEREDSPDIPLATGKRDEEVATVLDEDEEMQVDVKQEPGPASKKRRRAGSSAKQTKSSRSMLTRADSTSAPPSKRMKTTAMSLVTCILSLWRSPLFYYFGDAKELDRNNPNKVIVRYHDKTEDTVDISKIRRGEPRVGDVCVLNFGTAKGRAKIINTDQWESDRMLRIELLDDNEGEEMDVKSTDIKFAPRTVEVNWNDRLIRPEDIVPLQGGRILKDRSPSKMSVVSTGEVRNPKLLHKTAVAITLPGNLSDQRDNYARAIVALGGTVIEWSDAYAFQGKTVTGKRWFIRPEDVKFIGKGGITRLLLLSDAPCNRPKFLLALALGIPCVDFAWLDASASSSEEVDWSGYLLPAGVSATLSARTSQLVDLDWGNCLEHITNIMTNHVPAKVFKDMSILCLGAEFVSKKTSDAILEGTLVIPRVILCMGCSYVEAVAIVSNASKELTQFDYIVVKEGAPLPFSNGETYVDVGWVKDCLISSRLLPPPQQNT